MVETVADSGSQLDNATKLLPDSAPAAPSGDRPAAPIADRRQARGGRGEPRPRPSPLSRPRVASAGRRRRRGGGEKWEEKIGGMDEIGRAHV